MRIKIVDDDIFVSLGTLEYGDCFSFEDQYGCLVEREDDDEDSDLVSIIWLDGMILSQMSASTEVVPVSAEIIIKK